MATLPGSAFGEEDNGPEAGRYRLRMATSGLFFRSPEARYEQGYQMLDQVEQKGYDMALPILDEAIAAIQRAVERVKSEGCVKTNET